MTKNIFPGNDAKDTQGIFTLEEFWGNTEHFKYSICFFFHVGDIIYS